MILTDLYLFCHYMGMKKTYLFLSILMAFSQQISAAAPVTTPTRNNLRFIDASFENASPVWYETDDDGVIRIHLLYDNERATINRAAGHLHICIHAVPSTSLTLEFCNLDNIWNGHHGSVAREMRSLAISEDGQNWRGIKTTLIPTNRVQVTLDMPGPQLYIARIEPYRISDLERFLKNLRKHPLATVETIGKTRQGRALELISLGAADAPYSIFLRARAHPWESGGNWVMQGLTHRLLAGDAAASRVLARCRIHILPMANLDGVARGGTRFNPAGMDLNRNWNLPADPELAPENAALERWLAMRISAGKTPLLAIDLHNDGQGKLHVSRP
ncbi:MAG: M14 family zinc carboxypeptidase [Kiritimatiellia bacterium]